MSRASTPVVVMEFFTAGGAAGGPASRAPVARSGAARSGGRPRDGGVGEEPRRRPGAAPSSPGGSPLVGEGRALLGALLEDLAEVPGVRPVAVADPELAAPPPSGVERAPCAGDPVEAAVAAAARRPGAWLWPVAPETRGHLARACAAAEEAGVPVVAPSSGAVRRSALRRPLLRRMARAGLSTPPTVETESPGDARRAAEALGGDVVVKPGRGAGGAGTCRVAEPGRAGRAWSRAADVEPDVPPLVQPFVEGLPASVVLLCDGDGGVRPLALSSQRVRFDPVARYEGGRTPLRHPAARRAVRAAVRAAGAVDGLRGLVGVDLVLGPGEPVFMEINPRLTTSYLGLRAHAGPGVAAAALRAAGRRPEAPAPDPGPLPLGGGRCPGPAVDFDAGRPA